MPKQIIFVRHGETDHNKSKRLMNWTHDVGSLTEAGKKEAAIVGERLQTYPIHAMYVSDLQRTRETGEIISQHVHLTPIFVPELRERNLGIFGDLTFDEIKAKWPDKFAKFLDHADKEWHDFEGESLREVRERFTSFLEQMEREHADEKMSFS